MRIEALTILRFFAAIIIVMFHYGRNTGLANYANPFITSGPQMVSFFFVLSGFVMVVSHYYKNNETLREYYVARIARIIPLYIIALLITVYFVYGKGFNNLTSLLLSVTFLQSWFPPYPLSLNTPAWAMSVEAFFYIGFPIVLLLIRSSRVTEMKLVTVSVLFYLLTQAILSNLMTPVFYKGYPSASHDLIYYFPLSHFCSFLLGISCGYVYVKNKGRFHQAGFLPLIVLCAAFFLTYILLQKPEMLKNLIGFRLAYGSSFYSLPFALLILCVAYSKNFITDMLSLPILVILGESSYAIYIFQKPAYIAYQKYIYSHLKLSASGHFYVFLSVLILTSILVLYLIEKPAKELVLKIDAYITSKISGKDLS